MGCFFFEGRDNSAMMNVQDDGRVVFITTSAGSHEDENKLYVNATSAINFEAVCVSEQLINYASCLMYDSNV